MVDANCIHIKPMVEEKRGGKVQGDASQY